MSPPQTQEQTRTGKCSWVCTSTLLLRQGLSLTSHSPSCLSLQSVGLTGVHAQAWQRCSFLCFTVCVFSFLPYLSPKSPVSLLLGVCSQAGWSLVVDPQNKEKREKEEGGFFRISWPFFWDSFPYVLSFLSCLSPYPQDSIVSVCLLKCNFRRVDLSCMPACRNIWSNKYNSVQLSILFWNIKF